MIQDHFYQGAFKAYKSFIRVDSSVPLIRQDPSDLGQLFSDPEDP